MKSECFKPIIPRIKEFPRWARKDIALGDVPDSADLGAWRQLEPTDSPHPSHVRPVSETALAMIPVRLYGPGESCKFGKTAVTAVEGQEFDLSQFDHGIAAGI